MSVIDCTTKPAFAKPRTADSRPWPIPRIKTSTVFIPISATFLPTASATTVAAYGVDFGGDEEKIVAHLFKLYEAALNNENGKATIQKETTPKSTGIKVKVKRVNKQ